MKPAVHVSPDPTVVVARRMADTILDARELFVALSGGSTPKALFQRLATDYAGLPWNRVHLFQVDERCVPPDHEESNWRMMAGELLDHIPVAAAHRIEAERGGDGAKDYEDLIRREVPAGAGRVPVFDLVLLGMGEDGHTASLFPGTQALHECQRLVVHHAVPQLDTHRVTMTYPLLHAARRRWFLATGYDKRDAFERALRGEAPAGRMQEAEWFVDTALGPEDERSASPT